jgi:Ala-tRNA(Pro) deacylase
MRVPLYLADQQVPFERLTHPPAFTAQRRAKYLRVPGRELLKSVLLRAPEGYLLALLPATAEIDLAGLGQVLGGPVRLANREEIPEFFRDCEWGTVAPFGSLYGLGTLLEESVDPESQIVFEGHSHAEAIRMRCRDFERLEAPRRLRFARAKPAGRRACSEPR